MATDSRVGQKFGQYRITGLLGRGGMGEVYEAHDTSKGRTVALKILAQQYAQDYRFRARFLRESHAAAILQEPHVIPIHDWGEIDGCLFIDMRLVQGQTLHDLLRSRPVDPARAVHIVSQIAAALDAAHAAGLIHRDVKPANIVVTPADFAYLVDFGIASAVGESGLTMTGTHIGTFRYMAPERFGNRDTTAAVDVYSLACVLYESLTGQTPFAVSRPEQIIAAHISAPIPRPSQVNPRVPAAFDDVIARGMAKNPASRYGTTGALAGAAKEALAGRPSPQSVAKTMQAGGAQSRRRPRQWVLPVVIAVAGALLLGGVGVVIGVLANQKSDTDARRPPTTSYRVPAQTATESPTPASQPAPQPTPTLAPVPPPIQGPDQSANAERCEGGFVLPGATGFGTHAMRGTSETSCRFAESVLNAYWETYGDASRDVRNVSAAGSVDCRTVTGARCDGPNFVMECVAEPGNGYITCTGGRNARVYLY